MKEQRKYVHEDKHTHKSFRWVRVRVWRKDSAARATLGKQKEVRKEGRSYMA